MNSYYVNSNLYTDFILLKNNYTFMVKTTFNSFNRLVEVSPHFLQWELLNVIIYRGMVLTNCNYCNENSRSSNIVQCNSFNISVSKYLFIFVICLDNYTCSLFVKKKGRRGRENQLLTNWPRFQHTVSQIIAWCPLMMSCVP